MSRRPLPRRSAVRARSGSTSVLRSSTPSPLCQPLEPRLALSATVALDGTLIVLGSPQADTISIQAGATNGSVILTGVPGVIDGTQFTSITGLRVDLRSGDDTFSLTGDILNPEGQPAGILVLGGNGQDDITLAMAVGSPQVRGGNSHDTINGGPAGELLKGGRGIDTIFGNAGEDRLEGQLGRDSLFGGPGNDSLFGGFQPNFLWGNAGDDLLDGGRHGDNLFGGTGIDSMFGRQNADFFHGAPGELQDFTFGDQRHHPLFDPNSSGVTPGHVFWNRFAAGEDTFDPPNTDPAISANNIFVAAFAASTTLFVDARDAVEGLDATTRNLFLSNLLVITNSYSPSVLANPAGFSDSILDDLVGDLIAAAPAANGVATQFEAWVDAFRDSLILQGYIEAVRSLEANSPPAQAHLFAGDSVFSAEAWF